MKFRVFGDKTRPSLMLLPGLGVSYELFLPLIGRLQERFCIIAAEVDGFILGEFSEFTSIDDQAAQADAYVAGTLDGRLDCAYGLSMGGKILTRMLERREVACKGKGTEQMQTRTSPLLSVIGNIGRTSSVPFTPRHSAPSSFSHLIFRAHSTKSPTMRRSPSRPREVDAPCHQVTEFFVPNGIEPGAVIYLSDDCHFKSILINPTLSSKDSIAQ